MPHQIRLWLEVYFNSYWNKLLWRVSNQGNTATLEPYIISQLTQNMRIDSLIQCCTILVRTMYEKRWRIWETTFFFKRGVRLFCYLHHWCRSLEMQKSRVTLSSHTMWFTIVLVCRSVQYCTLHIALPCIRQGVHIEFFIHEMCHKGLHFILGLPIRHLPNLQFISAKPRRIRLRFLGLC